jgi:maleylacetate reductase
MVLSGRLVFGQMEEVVFGRAAAEAVADGARRLDAERVFLMVSGMLARETDEIEYARSSAIVVPASSAACRRTRRGRQ